MRIRQHQDGRRRVFRIGRTLTAPAALGVAPRQQQMLQGPSGPCHTRNAMAKKRSSTSPSASVTFERAARLYRLLTLLGKGAQTREQLVRLLGLGVRGF